MNESIRNLKKDIDKLKNGTKFELNDLNSFVKGAKGNKTLGKEFKKMVGNPPFKNIENIGFTNDRHDLYKKIN